uniref:AFG2 AAA ATPase homolog B n=1 Tax=Callorhinchus milii TaxID=7868 RepID=A0A4W3JSW1_CALMI|eukprot:gi/632938157/ref/XP_007903959.1/ PREDICTED: spermatogenesis-associated protein 5-like protein 1 [Callorhinchus milii]
MARTAMNLVPLDPRDLGSQRCRLGPSALASLGVKLGSPVQVSVLGGSALCTAWPRTDLADGFLQLDTKCATRDLIGKPCRGVRVNLSQLKAVPCIKLRAVQVKVIVKDLNTKKRAEKTQLKELVKDLLRNVYLCPRHVVAVTFDAPVAFIEIEGVEPSTHAAGLLTSKTAVRLMDIITVEHFRSIDSKAPSLCLGGMDNVLPPLKEILNLPFHYPKTLATLGLSCPRGVLLVGPPGVGKTSLVRAVTRQVGSRLIGISGAAVHGARPGESEGNLRRIFQQARDSAQEGPCVLFIDEIDSLCPRRGSLGNAPEDRLVAQLLTLMDGVGSESQLVVMAATNRPQALDPALRRPGRFDREVFIGVPTLEERRSILETVGAGMPLTREVDVPWLAEVTSGYVGADLVALCQEAAMQAVRRRCQDSADPEIRPTDFREALRTVHPSSLRSSVARIDFRPILWETIGGLEDVKLKLMQCIEWPMKFPDAFVRMGLTRPKGILLYGPPGCAKTTLVRAAATSCGCSFLSLSGADLFSPFVGDSEKILAQVFRQARAGAPSLLFLDEIDSILGSRSQDAKDGRGVHERVLSVLLNEMDGIGLAVTERRGAGRKGPLHEGGGQLAEARDDAKLEFQEVCNKDVIVVAATNRPDLLDDALLRPGRFDQIVYVPPPDENARVSALRIFTSVTPLGADVCLQELARQTPNFSGADLQSLCKEAALLALQESELQATAVNRRHFLTSLESFKPTLTDGHLDFYCSLFSSKRTSAE